MVRKTIDGLQRQRAAVQWLQFAESFDHFRSPGGNELLQVSGVRFRFTRQGFLRVDRFDGFETWAGQRFDRARVLRTLRQLHKELRTTDRCAGEAVNAALHAIRSMDIPHLEIVDEVDEVVH